MTHRHIVGLVMLLSSSAGAGTDLFEKLADPETKPYRITGKGVITDSGHPMHPGYFRQVDVAVRLSIDPLLGEAAIELESAEGEEKSVDRFYVRRGRVFQVGEKGEEVQPASLGDLSAATVAALCPAIVANAMRERRDMLWPARGQAYLFAWNDEIWTVDVDAKSGQIGKLARRTYSDVLGDGAEEVAYQEWLPGAERLAPRRVVVTSRGRETARIDFAEITRGITMEVPAGDRDRDRARVVSPDEVAFSEIAPHLFMIQLASMSTRVFVAEFADYLVVIEGVYNSRICDMLAQKVRARFGKPVRYFSFSHLHGQYVGGARSWVSEGATVLVPPTTVPLIEQMVKASHELRPDALSRSPRSLAIESVKDRRRIEDGTNALELYNVESGHTDEYFITYIPRSKILLTGDLLFYRPGAALTGRSRKLCETVEKLGLDVETYYVTWPLDGYGTKNVVTREEMRGGCGKAE